MKGLSRRLASVAVVVALPLAAAGGGAHAQPAFVQVEPEIGVATVGAKSQAGPRRAANSSAIRLDPPSADELQQIAPARKGAPLQVGIARPVAPLVGGLPAALEWQGLPDGRSVAALEITSPGAAALRIGLRVIAAPPDTRFRFYAPGDDEGFELTGEEILDAIALNLEAGALGNDSHTWWAPAIEGPTTVMEVELPAGARANDLRMAVPRLSHLVTSIASDFAMPKAAAACNNDATCSAADWPEVNAVARMLFVEGSGSYVCTGTLLADSDPTTTIPYFLTANHCISTQASATSLQTYWFYRPATCGGIANPVGTYPSRIGATLLYHTTATDTSFLRLNTAPPSGVAYAGWIAGAGSVPSVGAGITGIHHPTGDAMKISFGNVAAFGNCTAPNSSGAFSCSNISSSPSGKNYYFTGWTSGITQGGSSGSGLFRNSGRYLIGQLYGGGSSCWTASEEDIYGRFDVAYAAGLSAWLSATPPTLSVTLAGTRSGWVASSPAGIDCGATCSAAFLPGTAITLITQPQAGSTFAGWSGGGCSGTGTCTVTLLANTSVTATFTEAPPPSAGTNVALASAGAVATASSQYGAGYSAANVINNERAGTNWGSTGGWNDGDGGIYPDWVQVAFDGSKTISRVVVYTVQDNYASPVEPGDSTTASLYGLLDFTVQGWNGASWVTLGTVTGNGLAKRTVTFAAFTTDRIRIHVTSGRGGYSRLTEIEAWGVSAPSAGTNVALASAGAVATASSQYGAGYSAANVINNERAGTNWGSTGGWNDGNGGAYPDWVQVAFDGSKTISRVVVYTVQDNYASPVEPSDSTTVSLYGLLDFTVEGWNGAAWVTLGTVTGNGLAKRTVTFAAFTTDRIRIHVTTGRGGYSRITEIEAWGVPASTNVALASAGAVATASSQYGAGYSAANVINNERAGNNWGSTGGWNDGNGGAYPDWVQVAFDGSKTISRVVVYTVQDNYASPVEPSDSTTVSLYGLLDFTVEGWNGAAWVTLGTVTGNGLAKRTVTFAAFTTDRIRIHVTSGRGGYSRLTEIEAWAPQ